MPLQIFLNKLFLSEWKLTCCEYEIRQKIDPGPMQRSFVQEERGKHARNFPWGLKSYAVGNFPRRLFVRKNVCRFNGERISLGALCNLKAAHIPLLQDVM